MVVTGSITCLLSQSDAHVAGTVSITISISIASLHIAATLFCILYCLINKKPTQRTIIQDCSAALRHVYNACIAYTAGAYARRKADLLWVVLSIVAQSSLDQSPLSMRNLVMPLR